MLDPSSALRRPARPDASLADDVEGLQIKTPRCQLSLVSHISKDNIRQPLIARSLQKPASEYALQELFDLEQEMTGFTPSIDTMLAPKRRYSHEKAGCVVKTAGTDNTPHNTDGHEPDGYRYEMFTRNMYLQTPTKRLKEFAQRVSIEEPQFLHHFNRRASPSNNCKLRRKLQKHFLRYALFSSNESGKATGRMVVVCVSSLFEFISYAISVQLQCLGVVDPII